MKNLVFSLLALFLLSASMEGGSKIPSVKLKDLDGNSVNTAELSNDGKPMVISFWATWCAPCKKELNAIHEVYEDWQDETGVKVIAVSIDDARSATRVKPYVDAQGWDFEVLMDTNGDFKRSLNVNNVPQTFLIDGSGEIVWTHSGYSPGDEYELLEEIEKL
ncbi:MAG TPA: alkyl hydroperoxide reductase [Flavobacteriales bacterium]|nr:alkyl hydroperoxide reductase [Flavobacteriales bacterium]|tara:strand:+ start:11282 stop:11767 length:486 start_codon:yes stop_codon:yes gene_type:complete